MQTTHEPHPGKRIGPLTNLRPIMERHGIRTNPQLAAITGIPEAFCKDLTSIPPRKGASYRTAKQIARRLGVTVEELTGRPVGVVNEPDDTVVIEGDGSPDGLSRIEVKEVGGGKVPAFRMPDRTNTTYPTDALDLSSITDSVTALGKTLQTLVKEVGKIQSEQTEMKANIDLIKVFLENNPPRRRLFG
jgi:hypothetical protein